MKRIFPVFFSVVLIFSLVTIAYAAGDLAIIQQPQDFYGELGGKATFKVVASGDGLSYKWQYYNGSTWGSWDGTSSSISVTIKEQNLAYKFRVIVTDSSGNSVTSNSVAIYIASESSSDQVTTALEYVLKWVGAVISALVNGSFSGLLPVVAVAVAISGFMFGLKVIRGSAWGA